MKDALVHRAVNNVCGQHGWVVWVWVLAPVTRGHVCPRVAVKAELYQSQGGRRGGGIVCELELGVWVREKWNTGKQQQQQQQQQQQHTSCFISAAHGTRHTAHGTQTHSNTCWVCQILTMVVGCGCSKEMACAGGVSGVEGKERSEKKAHLTCEQIVSSFFLFLLWSKQAHGFRATSRNNTQARKKGKNPATPPHNERWQSRFLPLLRAVEVKNTILPFWEAASERIVQFMR